VTTEVQGYLNRHDIGVLHLQKAVQNCIDTAAHILATIYLANIFRSPGLAEKNEHP